MRKRAAVVGVLIVVLAVGAAAWFEPTRTVRGWALGEPFFEGRPASYWEAVLTGDDPMASAEAPERLERGKAAAVPVLIRLLASGKPQVRGLAADSLGKIGPPAADAIPLLLAQLDDSDPYPRGSAAAALPAIGPDRPEVVQALIAKLKTKDRDQIIRPLSILRSRAVDAVPELHAIVTDPKNSVKARWEAIRTLGKIGPGAKAVVPTLVDALKDEQEQVREHAAESLGEIGSPDAIPALTEALLDRSSRVRRDAVRSLGQLGPAAKAALPAAEKLLKDRESSVRDAAATAVGQIDPSRAVKQRDPKKPETPD